MSWKRGGTCREQEIIYLHAYLVSLREKERKLLLAWELLGFVSFGASAGWEKLGKKAHRELILSQTNRPGKEVTLWSWSKSKYVMESRTSCANQKDLCLFEPTELLDCKERSLPGRRRAKVCFWSFSSACPAQQCWGPLITWGLGKISQISQNLTCSSQTCHL